MNDKFIGTTVARKITVNILNPGNEIDLENKEIAAYAGINDEYVPFGNFIIEKPENEEVVEKTNFIGYDYMVKFNTIYEDRMTYPCETADLFEDVCDQVGLQAGNTSFVNSKYMILGNPFTNHEDCRTVLSNIAQLAGGFAKIGRDNKVYIKTLDNLKTILKVKDVHEMLVSELNSITLSKLSSSESKVNENLDGNNYYADFSKNGKWGEVNSLILRLSEVEGENTVLQDETSIEENGLTELTIEDNYFLIDEEEREIAIQPLWKSLKGLEYVPFKTQYYGYPYLDTGDIIYIVDSKETGYFSYVFNHTFKFNGAFSGTLETPALTKTQTAYKNILDVKTKFKKVEYKVDKINGEISSIVEEQNILEQGIDNANKTANNNYNDIMQRLAGYATEDDIVSVRNAVDTLQTSTEYVINVTEDIQTNGVSKITTQTGYTFDDSGLTVQKTGAKTKTILNEVGLDVEDATGNADESLLFAGYDNTIGETIVKSKNMTVQKYLVIGTYSRIEDYQVGTGIFWMGD